MAPNSHSAQYAGYSPSSWEDTLFTNAPLGITITTSEGRLLSVNPAMARMFGYDSPEELIESVKGLTTQLYADPSDREELIRLLEKNGEVRNYECKGVHRDGSLIWTSINVSTVRDNNGEILHFQSFITDITERKQVEQELREREAWLDLFFSQALSGTFFVMLDEPIQWHDAADKERLLDYAMTHLRTTRVNQAMLDQYGATEEDFIGTTPEDLFAHDLEQFRLMHRRLFDNGHLRLETREQRLDGTPIIIEGDYICIYDEHGRITGFFGIQSDITQRKQTEEALRESEERFKTVLENLPGGIFAHDLDGRIILTNAQAAKNTGYSREELLRMTVWDIDPYAASRDDQNTLWQRLETGESATIESVHTMKDGTQYPTEIHLNAIKLDEQPIILPIAFDISWRKQFEQALFESEQQFRVLFMESPVSITIHDKDDGEIVDANPQAYASYGLSSLEELKARGMFMEPPYSYTEALGWIRKAAAEGPQQFEWLSRDIYGELFWEQVRLIPITINGVERVVATTVDITELKETVNALHRSENYYRAIFETSGTAMFIIEEDTTISLVNSNFEELSGYSSLEMEGKKSWTDFTHPDDVEWMQENHYVRRRDPDAAPRQYEFRFINRREEERNVLLAVDMIPGTRRSIASCIDITQRKQMEEKLKEMSFRDFLTGLYNRNFFEEEMARLGDGRYSPIGIVVCDLDGLKFVNDTLGHHAGDRMLIQTADILQHNFRSSDIIARIGGDEFAILLAEIDREMLDRILRRLRQAVQDRNNKEPEIPLSLSMGHALDEGGTDDMQALFREADNRMYREKIQREGSARSAILQALTVSMEARDFNTENHCDRLQELAASLARSLNLSHDSVNDLFLLARFHDLGKVGIPDHILFKNGPLTKEEWRQMRQHCEIGHRIASSVPDLEPIADWILKHHEQWNGQGYPLGLSGQDIPLPCRILAIVDAFDAMTSDRPYRGAMSRDKAIAELRRCAGTQFDPDLVEHFIRIVHRHDF